MALFRKAERAVVVGAGLAGLRGAEAMRAAGFCGSLAIVGAEAHRPYDRPPLSKQVLTGALPADATTLPSRLDGPVEWHLGAAATRLDRAARTVALADGRAIPYDRLLIATGARAKLWADPRERAFEGVHALRGRDDAAALRAGLAARPGRVLVLGGGFVGCEVATACCDLGLPVTLVEPEPTLLAGVLGTTVGAYVEALHAARGVDLRCGVAVEALEDSHGRLTGARLADGSRIEATVAVVALGAIRNTGWLAGSGLAADERGLDCDEHGHALDADGRPDPRIVAAGDVARFPHPLYGGRLVALEHWSHAAAQGDHAGRRLAGTVCEEPYAAMPTFWSAQAGVMIKSVGLTEGADAVSIVQGDPRAGRFLALYGRAGRCIAAVSVDSARWLPAYAERIAAGAPFPPAGAATDRPGGSPRILMPGMP